jgi:hypothetical protein
MKACFAVAAGLAAGVAAAPAAADPAVLVSGQYDPVALAVDGNDIVWGGAGGVFRARRDGALPVRLTAIKTTAIAVDRADLFVGGPDAVWRLPGGKPPAVKLAPARAPARLAVGGGHVYWVQGTFETGGLLARVPKTGGPAETLFQIGDAAVEALALDLPDVYFTLSRVLPDADALMRVRVGGGGKPETLRAGDVGPCIAADGTHVYFTTGGLGRDNGRITRLRKRSGAADAGAAPELLAAGLRLPGDLFVHAGYVYALAMGIPGNQGAVARVPTAGGTLEVLANGQKLPFAAAHDDERIYWTALRSGNGAIMSHPLLPPPGPPLPLIPPMPPVCAGANLELDTLLRNADDCWPRVVQAATFDRVRVSLQPNPVVIAVGGTADVTVSLENATAGMLPLSVEAIAETKDLRVEVLRADGKPLAKVVACGDADIPPKTKFAHGELASGGRVTAQMTIAPRIVDVVDARCTRAFRPLKRGRYKLRVETPFYQRATRAGWWAEGTLLVK